MKKNIIILFITFNLVLNFKNSMAGCLKYLDKDLSSTKIQLEKFSCKKNKTKEISFQCSKSAPNGWAKYYSFKFKDIQKKVINCLG